MSHLVVERRGGSADVVAGDTGRQGEHLILADPWGNEYFAVSGHKAEHGPGGFEFLAPPGEGYEICSGFSRWTFNHEPGMTFLRWEGEPMPTPSPEPPSPSPEPPPGKIRVLPGRTYSATLEGDELVWHEGRAEGAAWDFVGHYLPGADLWLPEREPALPQLVGWSGELRLRMERLERTFRKLAS